MPVSKISLAHVPVPVVCDELGIVLCWREGANLVATAEAAVAPGHAMVLVSLLSCGDA